MQTFDLKPIHQHAVPAALEKAAWYRALHEPLEAESICRDVLAVDPGNQEAIRTLLLALTEMTWIYERACIDACSSTYLARRLLLPTAIVRALVCRKFELITRSAP